MAIFHILDTDFFVFREIWRFQRAEILRNHNSQRLKLSKWRFLPKSISRKILKFPHCVPKKFLTKHYLLIFFTFFFSVRVSTSMQEIKWALATQGSDPVPMVT